MTRRSTYGPAWGIVCVCVCVCVLYVPPSLHVRQLCPGQRCGIAVTQVRVVQCAGNVGPERVRLRIRMRFISLFAKLGLLCRLFDRSASCPGGFAAWGNSLPHTTHSYWGSCDHLQDHLLASSTYDLIRIQQHSRSLTFSSSLRHSPAIIIMHEPCVSWRL